MLGNVTAAHTQHTASKRSEQGHAAPYVATGYVAGGWASGSCVKAAKDEVAIALTVAIIAS